MGLLAVVTLVLCACVQASWMPEFKISDSAWDKALVGFDVASSYQSCKNEHSSSGVHKFLSFYKSVPVTYVLVGSGSGHLDVKFKDSNYVFENSVELTSTTYFVVPPYQPVEWFWIRFNGDITICSYEATVDSSDGTTQANGCDCTAKIKGKKSKSLTFPRTIRKPEQEFFLTADVTPDANDVTICTILTVDRLLRLQQMSEQWGGPISAAVYLHDLAEVADVMQWYLANNSMRRHVDIHLVQDDKIIAFPLPDRPFPVNILRNVAVRFARTSNVFYVEGDFIPSPDLYPSLGPVRERLAKGEKTAFIVAPFSTDKADFDMELFPKDKAALQAMVDGPNAMMRDLSYFNSHSAFNFREWFKASSIYPMSFTGGYEPYYIGPKSYPLFEEIFIGCGADKVSHPSELNSAGFRFQVLATGFIVHIDSTGMGSAWCRGWAGNERSTMKWEAFSTKTNHLYSGQAKLSFDSRVPWWDLAPVGKAIAPPAKGDDDEVCTAPPPPQTKECPVCKECKECPEQKECPICQPPVECGAGGIKTPCPPPSIGDCERFTETYVAELRGIKKERDTLTGTNSKQETTITEYETTIKSLRMENERLLEYSKFVVNVSIGVIVVMVVVVGVGVCVWPRGKKVFILPTWKATHHNL